MKKQLKQMRKKSGLSQNQVADKLGYSTGQFVSNWERGLIIPPISTLKTLAKMFKTPICDVKSMWINHQSRRFDVA